MNETTQKHCKTCGILKGLSEFGKHDTSKDRLRGTCKRCWVAYVTAYAATHKEEQKIIKARYKEKHRDEVLAKGREYKNRKYHADIEKHRAESRDYRRKIPIEVRRDALRQWRQTPGGRLLHRQYQTVRRMKKMNGSLPEKLSRQMLLKLHALYDYKCLFCGSTEALTIEHFHPFDLGGRHTLENLAISCKSCNSRKCKSEPIAWIQKEGWDLLQIQDRRAVALAFWAEQERLVA